MEFLEFEKPVADLQEKIAELQRVSTERGLNLEEEIAGLEKRSQELTREIFAKLNAWQITQLARHPLRPYTLDYISHIVEDFHELHGDRMFADDAAIVCGLGRIRGHRVAIVGHQKGRDTQARTKRNFGMPKPEGYRKARRIMELAGRFGLPVVTFIDTPGAYPGVDAEERGQSSAIATSIEQMSALPTPIISVVIGEGGSGGALAIGVCDHLMMLQYATYSVISPEGCASILWKSADKAADAAQAMGMTTADLEKLNLVDTVISEPLGGAHRDSQKTAETLAGALDRVLTQLQRQPLAELLQVRYARLMSYGQFIVEPSLQRR